MDKKLFKDEDIEEGIQHLVNSLPSALIIFSADDQGLHFKYTSDKCRAISGFTKEEIYNKHLENEFYEVHPDDRDIFKTAAKNYDERITLMYRVLTVTNDYKWVRVVLSKVEEDNEIRYYGLLTDIDEEYRKQQGIKQREEKLRLEKDMMQDMYQRILDETKGMITVIDADDKEIVYANASAIEGAGEDYIGHTCYQRIHNYQEPCPGCLLVNGHIGDVDVKEVEYGDQTYKMIKKIFNWNGRKALLEYSENITADKNKRKLLQSMVEQVPVGMGIYNIYDDRIELIYLNDVYYKMLGVSREQRQDFYGANALNAVHEDDRQATIDMARRLRAGKDSDEVIHRVRDVNGNWAYLSFKASVVERNETYTRAYGAISDYSEVMKVNQLLTHKYEIEKTRIIKDNSLVTYGVYNLEKNQTIEFDVKKKEHDNPLVMISFDRITSDISKRIPKEKERIKFLELLNRDYLIECYKHGIDEMHLDFQAYNNYSHLKWIRVNIVLMLGFDKKTTIAVVSCINIDKEKNLELLTSHITDEEFDLSGCVNFNTDDCVLIYGRNSARKPANQSIISEDKYSNALKWFVDNTVVEEERELFQLSQLVPKIKKELADKDVYKFLIHTVVDGVKRIKEIKYFNYDPETEIVYFAQRDITDLINKEEQEKQKLEETLQELNKANEATNQFMSRMSHDMRTPMNGILGLIALCKDETDLDVLKDNINKIQQSGIYLLGLINDALDCQKIDANKLKLEPKIVTVKEIIDDVLTITDESMKKKNLELKLVTKNVQLERFIKTDPMRIKQIFLNLITNAIKFTQNNGIIEIDIESTNYHDNQASIIVKIKDTGIGMSKEFIKDYIFKPFCQEHSTVVDNYAGSGLGLSIVKKLVELMDGNIEVDSELGEGTTFTVYLDLELVNEEEVNTYRSKQSSVKETLGLSIDGKNFLLVEDHPLNAEIASRFIKKQGGRVVWCKNGQEGLNTFNNSKINEYDIILMDIRMPVMDGIEATKRIRQLERADAKTVPIIAMTANAFEDDIHTCLAAGMNEHVAKPINVKILLQTLNKYL